MRRYLHAVVWQRTTVTLLHVLNDVYLPNTFNNCNCS